MKRGLRFAPPQTPKKALGFACCDSCKEFVNPRRIVPDTLRPVGWKEAYGGTCRMCMV